MLNIQNVKIFITKLKVCQLQMKKVQYLFLLLLILVSEHVVNAAQLFPNSVWIYWNSGQQSLGDLGKLCIKRIIQYNKNWQVKFISDKTLHQYLDANQMHELDQIAKFQGVKINPVSKSFFVRLILLKRYGGVWIDALTILLQNFDWLNQLDNNNQVMNNFESNPETFLFYQAHDPALARLNVINQNHTIFYPTIEIQTMLIAAVKDSVYINDLYNQLKQIHQKGIEYYRGVKKQLFLFRDLNEFQTLSLANHIIQHRKYRQFESNRKRNISSSIQNFYKIWAINRMKGPFSYLNERNIQILFKDVRHFTYQPKYLIKLQQFVRDSQLQNFMVNNSFQKDMWMRQLNQYLYDIGQYYIPNSYSCLYKSYIDENSIINQHLIRQFNSKKQFSIQNLQVSKNSQTPWICKKTTLYDLYDQYKSIWEFLYIPLYLIISIEFLIYITLCLKGYNIQLRKKNISSHNKESLTEKLYLFGLLGYTILLQYQFLHEEFFMWYYQSPYSLIICLLNLSVIFFILSYLKITQRIFYRITINIDIFICIVIVILSIQQLIIRVFSVWNFDGFLFHFQKLSRMNSYNNKQISLGFWKMSLMYFIAKIYFRIKRSFIKNYVQIEQKISLCLSRTRSYIKQKYKNQFHNQVRVKIRINEIIPEDELKQFSQTEISPKK